MDKLVILFHDTKVLTADNIEVYMDLIHEELAKDGKRPVFKVMPPNPGYFGEVIEPVG